MTAWKLPQAAATICVGFLRAKPRFHGRTERRYWWCTRSSSKLSNIQMRCGFFLGPHGRFVKNNENMKEMKTEEGSFRSKTPKTDCGKNTNVPHTRVRSEGREKGGKGSPRAVVRRSERSAHREASTLVVSKNLFSRVTFIARDLEGCVSQMMLSYVSAPDVGPLLVLSRPLSSVVSGKSWVGAVWHPLSSVVPV